MAVLLTSRPQHEAHWPHPHIELYRLNVAPILLMQNEHTVHCTSALYNAQEPTEYSLGTYRNLQEPTEYSQPREPGLHIFSRDGQVMAAFVWQLVASGCFYSPRA